MIPPGFERSRSDRWQFEIMDILVQSDKLLGDGFVFHRVLAITVFGCFSLENQIIIASKSWACKATVWI